VRTGERSLSIPKIHSSELSLSLTGAAGEMKVSAQTVSLFLGEREREIVFNLSIGSWERERERERERENGGKRRGG
jgi:hypothetical protein